VHTCGQFHVENGRTSGFKRENHWFFFIEPSVVFYKKYINFPHFLFLKIHDYKKILPTFKLSIIKLPK